MNTITSSYNFINIDENVENAAVYLINNSISSSFGLTDCVNVRRDNEITKTPAVNIKYNLGNPTGHYVILYDKDNVPRELRHDRFDGNLNISIITERDIDSNYHNAIKNNIRWVIGNTYYFNSGSLLPYHTIYDIIDNGSDSGIEQSTNIDVSNLNFQIKVGIKPDVWSKI